MKRSEQRCDNCDAFIRDRQQKTQGYCRDQPPRNFAVPMQVPAPGINVLQPRMETVIGFQSAQPTTAAQGWCRKWVELVPEDEPAVMDELRKFQQVEDIHAGR